MSDALYTLVYFDFGHGQHKALHKQEGFNPRTPLPKSR